jgi:hypothetical protein
LQPFKPTFQNAIFVIFFILLLGVVCGCDASVSQSAAVSQASNASLSATIQGTTKPSNYEVVYKLDTSGTTIEQRFPSPLGFIRESIGGNSFAAYLRKLPLKPHGTPVFHFDGKQKRNQVAASAVIDMDVGTRDLQQCADAIIRLRAEYLWQQQAYDDISFHFTNGFNAPYNKWRAGQRIYVRGNEVSWTAARSADTSYNAFRSYLNMVFAYAGTLSVAKELKPQTLDAIQIGDVFIQGGSPGHAIIVVDMVVHPETHQKRILLAQSYMPAQDIHVLQNPSADSPWYEVSTLGDVFRTPEWSFKGRDLRKF